MNKIEIIVRVNLIHFKLIFKKNKKKILFIFTGTIRVKSIKFKKKTKTVHSIRMTKKVGKNPIIMTKKAQPNIPLREPQSIFFKQCRL